MFIVPLCPDGFALLQSRLRLKEFDKNYKSYWVLKMFVLVSSLLKWFCAKMQAEIEQFKDESSLQEKNTNSRLRDIDRLQKTTEAWAEDYERQTSVISKILDDVQAGIVY